ncbi:hypothetical protein ACFQBQ_01835 [Granulicella cerasi]|uniref:Uncharacterized protein n=1 Tax=Granulicella cerasi TaxID=741063 RepID=A0ABW1Z4N4_9BACT|nr:hypothetical protein [Granulicella cerasi]
MRTLVAVAVLAVSSLAASAQTNPRHTGKWWLEKSNTYRSAYINGYQSGWHRGLGKDTPLKPFGAQAVTDGLDKFYGDFKNRIILLDDAITYVTDELTGTPKEKLEAELLGFRNKAAKLGTEEE